MTTKSIALALLGTLLPALCIIVFIAVRAYRNPRPRPKAFTTTLVIAGCFAVITLWMSPYLALVIGEWLHKASPNDPWPLANLVITAGVVSALIVGGIGESLASFKQISPRVKFTLRMMATLLLLAGLAAHVAVLLRPPVRSLGVDTPLRQDD